MAFFIKMFGQFHLPTPLVRLDGFSSHHEVFMKRDDLTHPVISGNKYRKLKYNLLAFKEGNYEALMTKGGYYSNHIAAAAASGKNFDIKTIGTIRGEKPLNPGVTLNFAQSAGMQLRYMSRAEFREFSYQPGHPEFENIYFLPEGGTNELALKGCGELAEELALQIDLNNTLICLASGTGGTTAGLADVLPENVKVLSFSALKGKWLKDEINSLLHKNVSHVDVTDEYCFGGYAKADDRLFHFINNFYNKYGIPLDPVYTAKMMYGLEEMLNQERITPGKTIIAIHTGGLQGVFGFQDSKVPIHWYNDPFCREASALKSSML